ncbi:hypothetical protein ELQ39_15845 [Streptomyces sp. GB4-14]|uniref:hypothetical protein n=1 Tax=Streptomyces sp. GB4-14 TaxID=2498703 RepID=UPI001F5E5821|nr:hypothetical protein [Streptomyces sp. GB4-14]
MSTAYNPTGPLLTYTSTLNDDGTQDCTHIDRVPVTDPRERAICRALLLHALALLDASEPTRRSGEAQR